MAGLRYVYAVCRPFDTPLQSQLIGVAGAPPKLVHHHGLVAVVSTVPEADFAEEPLQAHLADPDWLARMTRAHRQVVDALTVVTTPLPLRPATVVPDDSMVRVMIEEREERFRHVLDRLQGRVEWVVRVHADPDEDDTRRTAEAVAERLHARLAARADAARLRTPPARSAVLDAAYLVARAGSEEFVEIIDRTKRTEAGVRTELTGPWAAYSFVESAEEPE
ncbi:GvpL/GvpF family gas vesicle protein [Streptomyces sp. NPDC018693]|uniref:GvpL/GvpF family gas vesicle protein n=1 Tax=unclassified Streptomyces TaxID=2593676 RepID=UPI0037B57AB8